MKTLTIIPSRLSATRLPGKPLLKINNLSIISHVFRRAQEANIGDVVVDDVTYRRYRAPRSWNNPITELYALLKKISKSPLEETDIVPIKSIGALKSGILAVAYENVNDMERADAHWQKFMLLMERAQKQYNGGRKISIRFNDNIRKRPTQFK